MQKLLEAISKPAAERILRSFSKMTGKNLSVDLMELGIESLSDIKPLFEPEEETAALVYMDTHGDIPGMGMLVFQESGGFLLADFICGRRPGSCRGFSDMDKAALMEAGNIVVGNFLSEISNYLNKKLISGLPEFSCDKFGATYDKIIAESSLKLGEVLAMEAIFVFEPVVIKGYLLFLCERKKMEEAMAGGCGEPVRSLISSE